MRENTEDITPLAQWCLKQALASMGSRVHPNLHAEMLRCASLLQSYPWPGNVRELRNAMERVALTLSVEPLQAITPIFMQKLVPELAVKNVDAIQNETHINTKTSESLDELMAKFNNNREDVAQYLGISRTTLWRRLRQLQKNEL